MDSSQKRALIIATALLLGGACLAGSLAAQDPQRGPEGLVGGGQRMSIIGAREISLVTFMRSSTTTRLGGNVNVATAISVTNLEDESCDVSVDFVKAFETTPSCTLIATLEAGADSTFCSRNLNLLDAVGLPACAASCAPELDAHDGRVIVSAAPGCVALATSGNIVYTSAAEDDLLATSSPQVLDVFEPLVFQDGFDSGTVSNWSIHSN